MKYEIKGGNLPVVVCNVAENEAMLTEAGGMSWMSPNMQMETVGGGVGKILGRMFSGETLFLNKYTAKGGEGMIAFASSFPGNIIPIEIAPGKEMIAQKSAFLASEAGVELSIYFKKKLGAGFFGGEGFIMQKLSGQGTAFLEIDGSVTTYELKEGQQIVVSTGLVAAFEPTCKMEIVTVKGVKNVVLGGEGLFNTVITGPGKVMLQSISKAEFARSIMPAGSN